MRNHIDGLIISLAVLVFYLASTLLAMTFFGAFLFSIVAGEMGWIQRNLFLVIILLLLLYSIHNTFFVLFFRNLWLKYFPKMKHWHVNLICWGTFLVPGVLHVVASSGPAWKRGTRRAKWLFLLCALFFLVGVEPFFKFLPWPLYTDILFYFMIVFFVLRFAFYRAVSPDALSRWAKWSSIMLCVIALFMILCVYKLTVLADMRYASSVRKHAVANIPANRAQFYQFFYDGTKVGKNIQRWDDLMGKVPSVPQEVILPNTLMTPELRAKRDNYLKSIEPVMDEINQLVFHEIKPDLKTTIPLVSCSSPHLNQIRNLTKIYSMRMQLALDGEKPNIESALADFRRSRELLKFCEPVILGSLLATAVEGIRLEALGEMYARADLSADDCRLLDKELALDEQLINRSFNRNIRMEAVCLPDVADMFLDGEAPGAEKYPFRKLNRILSAPFYVMLIDTKTFSNRTFYNFIVEVVDNPSDYWQLSKPIKWPKGEEYSSNPLCAMLLPAVDAVIVKKYEVISRIRAMRLLLREKAGMPTNDLRDPFADASLKVIKGEFKGRRYSPFRDKIVRGIRIYSVGENGIDNKGEKDDVTFEIVTELVE